MRVTLTTAVASFSAAPAFAATGPFFSLNNTDFVVLLAFLLFIAVLFYFKVPGLLVGMLDKRAMARVEKAVVRHRWDWVSCLPI